MVNQLSVAENILLNNYSNKILNWRQINNRAEEFCKKLKINIDVTAKVNSLSIGQRQLVELMKSLAMGSKLIVMDEPSATLSKEEFNTLLATINDLRSQGITIIYISHRLEELFLVGDRITVLRDGKNVTTVNVKDINVDQLVEYMIGYQLKPIKRAASVEDSSKEKLLELENICTHKVSNISLSVGKGEIVGIYGLVGSGRTELLYSIFGVDKHTSGQIKYKGKAYKPKSPLDAIKHGVGLVPENRKTQGLILHLSVMENAAMASIKRFTKCGIILYKNLATEIKNYIEKIRIKTPSQNELTRNLSGGNQQKVVLTKWLMKDCELLLVDEPTQGIDVGAKEEIYKLLRSMSDNGKSILVASSELEELQFICDKIAVLYEGSIVNIFNKDDHGDYILQAAISGRSHK